MVQAKVTIKNPTGLHLRPAGILCKEALKFDKATVHFKFHGSEYNAKSVLSVLGACVSAKERKKRRQWMPWLSW